VKIRKRRYKIKKMENKGAKKDVTKVSASKKIRRSGLRRAPTRLWVKAAFTGFRRSKVNQYENQALLKIQGVNDALASWYYWGKRVAFIYKAHKTANNTKYRAVWGKISTSHGKKWCCYCQIPKKSTTKSHGIYRKSVLIPK